ncbi:MAG: Clp1/GlmU family protein [Candidatus Bathyarchaeia archaeon]
MMKRKVESGRTLLVDGPASVNHVSGDIEVLGAKLEKGEKVVIREGKRVPFMVKRKATFDLTLGEDASFEEVEGSTIPSSWDDALKEIKACGRPLTVMVMGEVDSGKTSFCTYLINHALKMKWKAAIIDADLGQSDVGPPSTMGFSRVTMPIKDLFEIEEAEKAHFVGLTSPSQVIYRVMEALVELKKDVESEDVDFLVINTDGWISGEEAVRYKVALAEKVKPDVVAGIQESHELVPILTALKETKTLAIDSPSAIKKRSQEKRKVLRELGYKKYLKKAKIRSFPLNWVKVERVLVGTGTSPQAERVKEIEEILGTSPVYCEENPTTVFVVLRRNSWIDEERVRKIEDGLEKWVRVIRDGEEEGLLVGLHNENGVFLGIGILDGIDYRRRVMKVYTPVSEKVSSIRVGQIKLDKDGREIGLSPVFSRYQS